MATRKKNGKFNFKAFGRAITEKREKKGLTVRATADTIGISVTPITRAEKGMKLDIDTIIDVCNWLDKPVQHFITKKAQSAKAATTEAD